MKPVKYTGRAREDLRLAVLNYRGISPGLVRRFRAAFRAALKLVRLWPFSGTLMEDEARRILMGDRFPYSVFYIPEEDHILVVAVMRDSMNPEVWKERL